MEGIPKEVSVYQDKIYWAERRERERERERERGTVGNFFNGEYKLKANDLQS